MQHMAPRAQPVAVVAHTGCIIVLPIVKATRQVAVKPFHLPGHGAPT